MAWGQVKWSRLSYMVTHFFPFYWQQIPTLCRNRHIQAGPISYPILESVTVGQRKKRGWCMSEKASWFPLLPRCIEQCP